MWRHEIVWNLRRFHFPSQLLIDTPEGETNIFDCGSESACHSREQIFQLYFDGIKILNLDAGKDFHLTFTTTGGLKAKTDKTKQKENHKQRYGVEFIQEGCKLSSDFERNVTERVEPLDSIINGWKVKSNIIF